MSLAQETILTTEFPVAVMLEYEQIRHGRWQVPRWRVLGVVTGDDIRAAGDERRLVHDQGGRRQYLCGGFVLRLHRDAAESYWYNLVGRAPTLFVICQSDVDGELHPRAVTADYMEANAHMEADDTVFSTPIPPEIYLHLERFVVTHYQPQAPRKRKRKNWTAQATDDQTPG